MVENYLFQEEMLETVLPLIEKYGVLYEKFQPVLATVAKGGEEVITVTSDSEETRNIADVGDYIVSNQTGALERYVIKPEKFEQRYEFVELTDDAFGLYRPIGEVWAVQIDEDIMDYIGFLGSDSFNFEAAWGENMVAKMGDMIVTPPTKDEVYRIAKKEFEETYRVK